MALIVDLATTPYGIPAPSAYARISLLRADKDGITMQVLHYVSEDAARAGAEPLLSRTEYAPSNELQAGMNPLAIGYAWLKNQPGYIDSRDT
jgi:hypothetical protein